MKKKLNQQNIIGVFNNKGGVGKSTTVNSISCYLASQGYKTLIIDSDSQAHQTLFWIESDINAYSKNLHLEDYISQQIKIANTSVKLEMLSVNYPNLYLLTNKKAISSRTYSGFSALDQLKAFKNIMPDNEFDFIIIDLPPNFDLPALNCFLACDYIISPVEYSELSKNGLLNLLSSFDEVKEYNSQLQFLGCFGSKVNNSFKNTKKYREFYKQYPDIFLTSEIRQNQTVADLPNLKNNIFNTNNEDGKKDFINLSEELITKIINLKSK